MRLGESLSKDVPAPFSDCPPLSTESEEGDL